jgi:hypothetical protein
MPEDQRMIPDARSSAVRMIAEVSAENARLTATPARASLTGCARNPPPTDKQTKPPIAPPRMVAAKPGKANGNNRLDMTRASCAPLVTARISGAARGLRRIVCMMVPAAARDAPTRMAANTRGSRIVSMIICATDRGLEGASNRSRIVTLPLPAIRSATNRRTSSTIPRMIRRPASPKARDRIVVVAFMVILSWPFARIHPARQTEWDR